MNKQHDRLAGLREIALQRIQETRVAGRNTRHNRSANLDAIRGLVNGDPHNTFGIAGLEGSTFEESLAAISGLTQCSSDPTVTEGGGYISPASTLKALEEAAARIAQVAQQGGTVVLGTGHPGSLLYFYIELARLIRSWGGTVLEPERGSQVPPNLDLDYIDGVAVTTDRASLMHTHDFRAMERMLDAAHINLAIVDHGYAGAAINAGVPTIVIMDTNDPAFALIQSKGADLTVIPMDDNRPLSCYLPIVETIREFGEALVNDLPQAELRPLEQSPLSDELRDRLRGIERLVASRLGPSTALDEQVRGLLTSFRDQFLQMHLEPDEHDRFGNDPALQLVVYRQFYEAFLRAVLRSLSQSEDQINPQAVVTYLEQATIPEMALSG